MDVRWLMVPCLLVVVVSTWPPPALSAPSTYNPLLDVAKDELKKLLHKGTAEMGTVTCDVCKVIVGTIQRLYDSQTGWDEIAKVGGDICYWFKIEDENVCKAITEEFKVRTVL